MEIIAACIESGCYSAVFAVLLVYAVRSHAARERYYRKVIDELTAGLCDLEHVHVRLDEIKMLCSRRSEKKKGAERCASEELKISAAERS